MQGEAYKFRFGQKGMENFMADFVDTFKKGVEKTLDSAESVTKAAIKKTSESVNAMKINYSIKEANSNIDELYKALGMMLYKEYTEGSEFTGEYRENCEKITEYKAEISQLKAKLAEMKNQRICPECNGLVSVDSQFCSSCGNALED